MLPDALARALRDSALVVVQAPVNDALFDCLSAPEFAQLRNVLARLVPCGVRDERFGVTSLAALGLTVTMAEVDAALKLAFEEVFGPVTDDRTTAS